MATHLCAQDGDLAGRHLGVTQKSITIGFNLAAVARQQAAAAAASRCILGWPNIKKKERNNLPFLRIKKI